MARITVEDCLDKIDNRFDMTLIAAERARQISMGGTPMVPLDDDKPTVIALREIAEGLMSREVLDQLNAAAKAADEELLKADSDEGENGGEGEENTEITKSAAAETIVTTADNATEEKVA